MLTHNAFPATLVNSPDVSDNSCTSRVREAAARPLTPLGYNWGEQKEKINKSEKYKCEKVRNTNARKREILMQENNGVHMYKYGKQRGKYEYQKTITHTRKQKAQYKYEKINTNNGKHRCKYKYKKVRGFHSETKYFPHSS